MKIIETPLQAYFLGWMYSDGCVIYNKQAYSYCTRIKLKRDLSEIRVLNMFLELHNFKKSSSRKVINENKVQEDILIYSYNREFALNLINLGVLPKKSKENRNNLKLPNIEPNLRPYFIRGLFDGDGNYDYYNRRLCISLYMSNDLFLDSLQKWFSNELNINFLRINSKTKKLKPLKLTKNDEVKLFIDYVFKDNLNLILDRKYVIVKDFLINYSTTKDKKLITNIKTGLANKGKIQSLETRKKRSEARLGKRLSEQRKKYLRNKIRENSKTQIKVYCDNQLLGSFVNAKELEEASLDGRFKDYINTINSNGRNGYPFYFLSNKGILACINGTIKNYKGLIFKRTQNAELKLDELLETPKDLSTNEIVTILNINGQSAAKL